MLGEHNGTIPGTVSSQLSLSQMRRDVLPACRALKSSCPQGHLPTGLGASLNTALNCHAAQRRKKCLSLLSANGRELSLEQNPELCAGKPTPNVPIFRRKCEFHVSGQALPQQSLSLHQLICIQEHEQNLQFASGKPQQRVGEHDCLVWLQGEHLDAHMRPWVKWFLLKSGCSKHRAMEATSTLGIWGRNTIEELESGMGGHPNSSRLSLMHAEHPGCSSRCFWWTGGCWGAGGSLLLCKGKALPWSISWSSCKALPCVGPI